MALQIPGYRVIRKINQGGMSTVYLAIQISVGRVVALKVMNPQLNNDPAFSERFQREANIVGQLSHPNIVSIYDIGRHEDLNYIAMDYLPNGTVHDKMANGISGEEALRITRQMASALDHSHEKGYIHRDIKPENILFRSDNSAVLSDFGVARGVATNSRMTQVGTVVGTPHYMSPEQTKGKQIDGRSDLYSLGVVLFEMLTGSVPYQGDEAVTIALKHISAPIPKLPMQYLAYQKIIDKLLAKDPDQRYQRGRDLVSAIEELEKSNPIHRSARTTHHPVDMTVVSLFKALIAATHSALRWRWNKVRNLRWDKERGFYSRQPSKITDIFFNEHHENLASANANRDQIDTRVHAAVSGRRSALSSLLILLLAIGVVGGGFYWLKKPAEEATIVATESTASVASNTTNSFSGATSSLAATTAATTSESTQSAATQSAAPIVDISSTQAAINEPIATTPTENVPTANGAVVDTMVPTYTLDVDTSPVDARVRILNIPERYQPGILLEPGRYHIEVSAPGYETRRSWIEVIDQSVIASIALKQSEQSSPAALANTKSAKGDTPEMVQIPAGHFFMGNKDDVLAMPVHKVTLRAFAISQYEITFDEYEAFAKATERLLPNDHKWGRGNRPVINVTYTDARAYTEWLSKKTGRKYRLPTEAEWEYAARAGSLSLYWWGDDDKDAAGRANCRRGCNSKFSGLFGSRTAPVGSYPANGFGLYDTAGNVSEWVQDCFAENYNLHPKNGQAYEVKNCTARVARGGSSKHTAQQLATHIRDYFPPDIYNEFLGFRVVMEL